MHRGSKNRLMPQHAALFPDASLFGRIARTVCAAKCLPRKELYEAWEVARRVRRRFRGGRVVDWACGHGVLAHLMLLLDDTSPRAIAYDRRLPPSAARLHHCLVGAWPRLEGRVSLSEGEPPVLGEGDVVVSCHACGALTDDVLDRARAARARVAVLPCCHDADGDDGGLRGWLEVALSIDVTRAAGLRADGYSVWTQTIPSDVTPKNRLLLASPHPR